MRIQKADDKAVQEIMGMIHRTMHEGTMGHLPEEGEKASNLVQQVLDKGAYFLAAQEEDDLAGWVLFGTNVDYFTDAHHAFIYDIYVLEKYRGRGLARKLVMEAMKEGRRQGAKEIRLNVFAGNPARKLYEEIGFDEFNILMSKNL
ncbi:GNAT family N-acetyltransferase [Bacillus marinisedimentorum]|uniref:GNAT family N-acetyltransferase n=1 Tax=Bacillus marinisedimentorum TaxID=1821260 RepID=UPI0008722B0D|nr:GNAT family N-acetyltransferase [Bacillus marinisedimentorum]